eukprot:1802258-Prymnesium_polylepis.3
MSRRRQPRSAGQQHAVLGTCCHGTHIGESLDALGEYLAVSVKIAVSKLPMLTMHTLTSRHHRRHSPPDCAGSPLPPHTPSHP